MKASFFTPRQRDILLQATGLDRGSSAYRNCFVCRINGLDDHHADELAEAGLMTCEVYDLRPNSHLYKVTPSGLESARAVAKLRHQQDETAPRSLFDVGTRMSLKGVRNGQQRAR